MDYSLQEDWVERFFEAIKRLILPSENNNYESKFLQSNALLYCVILLLILKIVTTSISVNFPKNIFFADITRLALENSVNQTRQSAGLQPLAENTKLDQAAQLKAENMVQDQYFDHTSPSGVTPWSWFLKAGYSYKYAGENLAIGFYDSQEVYDAWLNSPSHKANIVNPNYTEIGTAVLSGFGQNNSIVVVQEFGSQLPVKQVAVKSNNPKPIPSQVAVKPTIKTTVPAPVATNIAPAPATNEKVLSQETETQNLIKPASGSGVTNLPAKAINNVLYNYAGLLQDTIYGISLVVMGILITLIFFSFRISFKRQLVFRALLILVILSAATLLNKETIIYLIPHQVII